MRFVIDFDDDATLKDVEELGGAIQKTIRASRFRWIVRDTHIKDVGGK